jgi:Protein of unknown function (DUF4232)
VSLLDHTSAVIGAPATQSGEAGQTIILNPGDSASSLLRTKSSIDPSLCVGPSSEIRVFPPESTRAITSIEQFTSCGGFSVTTLRSGVAG